MKKSFISLSAAVLLLAGCHNTAAPMATGTTATSADIQALRAEMASVKAAVQQAAEMSQQASLAAQDAKATAVRTEGQLNNMFRKSQMK